MLEERREIERREVAGFRQRPDNTLKSPVSAKKDMKKNKKEMERALDKALEFIDFFCHSGDMIVLRDL